MIKDKSIIGVLNYMYTVTTKRQEDSLGLISFIYFTVNFNI